MRSKLYSRRWSSLLFLLFLAACATGPTLERFEQVAGVAASALEIAETADANVDGKMDLAEVLLALGTGLGTLGGIFGIRNAKSTAAKAALLKPPA